MKDMGGWQRAETLQGDLSDVACQISYPRGTFSQASIPNARPKW